MYVCMYFTPHIPPPRLRAASVNNVDRVLGPGFHAFMSVHSWTALCKLILLVINFYLIFLQLIQELKKENFDLKLRLYMEQKEREVSNQP